MKKIIKMIITGGGTGGPLLSLSGNGYADDLIGWDPAGKWANFDPDPDPFPKIDGVATDGGTWAHGSHVACILSATSDNSIGMASTVFIADYYYVQPLTSAHDILGGVILIIILTCIWELFSVKEKP